MAALVAPSVLNAKSAAAVPWIRSFQQTRFVTARPRAVKETAVEDGDTIGMCARS